MRVPFLITGLPRSGYTIYAQMMKMYSNHWGGSLCEPEKDKNFMQNRQILRYFVQPILKQLGVEETGYATEKPKISKKVLFQFSMSDLKRILYQQNYNNGAWFYADYRNILIWEIWNTLFPNAHWLVVIRNKGKIQRSWLKTGYLPQNVEVQEKIIDLYENELIKLVENVHNVEVISEFDTIGKINNAFNRLGIQLSKEALIFIERMRK